LADETTDTGQALTYFCFEDEKGQRAVMKRSPGDEARVGSL
jgi:hypothetical protein